MLWYGYVCVDEKFCMVRPGPYGALMCFATLWYVAVHFDMVRQSMVCVRPIWCIYLLCSFETLQGGFKHLCLDQLTANCRMKPRTKSNEN